MTFEQAVQAFKEEMFYDAETGEWSGLSPHGIVTALGRLGVIKFEEPKTATEKAFAAINRYVNIRKGPFEDTKDLLATLSVANVRIVDA